MKRRAGCRKRRILVVIEGVEPFFQRVVFDPEIGVDLGVTLGDCLGLAAEASLPLVPSVSAGRKAMSRAVIHRHDHTVRDSIRVAPVGYFQLDRKNRGSSSG